MAINFGSSNLSSVDYNLHTIQKFNGVDYTTTPTLVDESRAIDISNYLPRGNSLVKRNGYEMVTTLTGIKGEKLIIKGIAESPILTYYQQFLNATYHFVFVVEEANGGYINPRILGVANLLNVDEMDMSYEYKFYDKYDYDNPTVLKEEDLYFKTFYFEKRTFILCMGDYLMTKVNYSGEEISSIEIDRVKNNAFVPTIVTNLADDRLNFKTTQLQQFNILTNKCYIEITVVIGSIEATTEVYEVGRYFAENQTIKLLSIDGTTINNEEGTYIEKVGHISYDSSNRQIQLTDKSGQLEEEKGKIYTIKLEFEYSQQQNKTANVVEKMRFGIPYGSYGHTDRLFLSGNPDYPNLDIHSCETNDIENPWKDYTYFGDNSYSIIGNDNSAITSYGFLNNGYMAVFKESKLGQPNLYLRNYQMVTTEEGYLEEVFPIHISGISVDIDINSEIINYENDLLVNCPKGIYKIIAGESTATQTYNSTEVSYFIRDNLSNDISGSSHIIYDNKLYISRKDVLGRNRVYIADYKRYGYIDGRQVYEWFVLDDLNVDKFFVLNNELYFSNEKGLFRFSDTFEDFWFFRTKNANVGDEVFSEEVFVNETSNRIILSSTNEVINDILNSDDEYDRWQDFKRKTKIRISTDFLIKVEKDIPTVTFDENTNKAEFQVMLSGEENQLLVPTILMNLLSNMRPNQDALTENPAIIYNKNYYVVEDVIFEGDRYTIKTYLNTEESGENNDFTNEYIILQLNCLKQHFSFDIAEMYCNSKYDFSKCIFLEGNWYYQENQNDIISLGYKDLVFFNEFSLKLYNFDIDFSSRTGYIRDVIFNFYKDINSYWYSKFMDLGRLDYLKTMDRFTFVADAKRGGETNVGFRTMKKKVLSSTSVEYKNLEFDNIDFSNFSFSTNDFAKTQTIKKKIKNFSFVQLVFESNVDKDSSITSISFRYKYTKNNKGVK